METAVYNRELALSLTNGTYTEEACSSSTRTLYAIDSVLWAGETPSCGEVVIATTPEYGVCLFTDKEIQSASSDEAIYHEHLVHPVLNATAHIPRKHVLVVGGGEGATAREALKWSTDAVGTVDWVDIDKPLVDLCRRHMVYASDEVYNDPRLAFHAADIRTFLTTTTGLYDVIVLDLPDPDVASLVAEGAPLQPSLYSASFFRLIKSRLAPDGVVATHCGPVLPGGNPERRRAGLHWIQRAASAVGLGRGAAYHASIPSFQGEWGFWMSTSPSATIRFPAGLFVMDSLTQTAAFSFPDYWLSSFVGVSPWV
jgi:spermidine synthase